MRHYITVLIIATILAIIFYFLAEFVMYAGRKKAEMRLSIIHTTGLIMCIYALGFILNLWIFLFIWFLAGTSEIVFFDSTITSIYIISLILSYGITLFLYSYPSVNFMKLPKTN